MLPKTLTAVLLCAAVAWPAMDLAAQSTTLQKRISAPSAKQRETRKKLLAREIQALLSDPAVARGFWGMQVLSLDHGDVLFEVNSDKLFTPASATKLLTSVAAFARLGPDYRFRTTVETSGTIDSDGRLNGDLLLVGRGDPNLSGRVLPYDQRSQFLPQTIPALEGLASQVVAKGLKEIEGDIVGDDSYFAFQRFAEGWSQDDLMWPSGAPASALSIGDNEQTITISPAPSVGLSALVRLEPDVPYYEIDNRVLTVAPGTGPRTIGMDRQPGSKTLVIWGSIPLEDTGSSHSIAVDDPAGFAAQAFTLMLQQRGVKVSGKHRAQHMLPAALPLTALSVETNYAISKGGGIDAPPLLAEEPKRSLLAMHESGPLFQDLRIINKVSQNLHSEIVLRTLGRERGPSPTLEGGVAVVRGVMDEAGLAKEEYSVFDGSGMSSQNLVTPRALVRLLQYADQAPWGPLFKETLPIAGLDGSLYDRMRNTVAEGRVRAKTGTLTFVNALAGYAQTVRGERLAFAIASNHHRLNSNGAKRVIDTIVEIIVDDGETKPTRRRRG